MKEIIVKKLELIDNALFNKNQRCCYYFISICGDDRDDLITLGVFQIY